MTKLALGLNFTQSIFVLEYIPKLALILLKFKKKKRGGKGGECEEREWGTNLTLHSQSK